ncbi:hypothetical protein I5476_09485 [Citrobacter braakii]|uniref:hypothetical protein n=1 Tax=Citrobacter braakii TaxID=57706 RepID=UPI001906E715|nr:hypothetical protein [Citrobacter braakii]MBJ9144283.1 hypothetical protein [Citrobacter braakii]
MPITNKIEAKDFYQNLPSIDHETGDIWLSLPCWGVAKLDQCSGVVITPACDLSQKKAETVLILPVIPISDYLVSKAFFYDVWTELSSKIKNAGGNVDLDSRFDNPKISHLTNFLHEIEGVKKHKELYNQVIAYIDYIKYTDMDSIKRKKLSSPSIEAIFGKKRYETILKKMLTNSYKSDVHFLPAFRNAGDYSAIQNHSLALFRHAYSAPIELFDAAQMSSDSLWPTDQEVLVTQIPIAKEFKSWPIKVSKLKDEFLSDLISRYLSMFMRLGSRDFTSHTIDSFLLEIKDE